MNPFQRRSRRTSPWQLRLLVAAGIILFSLLNYWATSELNPITGKPQRVGGLTPAEEVAMGLQSLPYVVQQFQGLSPDALAGDRVRQMGEVLVQQLERRLQRDNLRIPYRFQFHLLADRRTVNAFALPGGQIFITEALYRRLTHPGQLAGVLGHEMGHVLERHSAQQLAKGQLFAGMSSAAGVATGDVSGQAAANFVTQLVSLKYSRSHELESDRWGVELMALAGYHPGHLLEVMNILEESTGSAGTLSEFTSTHPRPATRRQYIDQIIAEVFPAGIPEGLQ